jgi:hypothetical protein
VDGKTLVDSVYKYFVNIGQATLSDTVFQNRILFRVQQVVDEVCYFRPWSWMQAGLVNVVIANTGYGSLPTDYGNWMAVDNKLGKYKLEYMTPARLFDLRDRESGTDSKPRWFTISDEDPVTRAPLIQVHKLPTPSVPFSVDVTYQKSAPAIAYSTNPSGMEKIPPFFHNAIYEGVVALMMEDEGDGRSVLGNQKFRRRIMEIWAFSKPSLGAARRGPRYAAALLGRRLWR